MSRTPKIPSCDECAPTAQGIVALLEEGARNLRNCTAADGDRRFENWTNAATPRTRRSAFSPGWVAASTRPGSGNANDRPSNKPKKQRK